MNAKRILHELKTKGKITDADIEEAVKAQQQDNIERVWDKIGPGEMVEILGFHMATVLAKHWSQEELKLVVWVERPSRHHSHIQVLNVDLDRCFWGTTPLFNGEHWIIAWQYAEG